ALAGALGPAMEGKRFLRSIELKNLLSYGPEGVKLELEPLNVLIGPNASGKSNLIQALRLLQAAPRDIKNPPRWDNSGVKEWMWKGRESGCPAELAVSFDESLIKPPLSYLLRFHANDRLKIDEESLFDTPALQSPERPAIVRRQPSAATLLRADGGDVQIDLRDDESI